MNKKILYGIIAAIAAAAVLTGCDGTANLTGSVKSTAPVYTETETEETTLKTAEITTEASEQTTEEAVNTDIPKYAVNFEEHAYYVYNSDWEGIESYSAASEFCKEKGGYMAVISSDDENDFLYKYITDEGYASAYFGYEYLTDQGWAFPDDSSVSYTNWGADQPDESGSNFYAKFGTAAADGSWVNDCFGANNDNPDNMVFICEWDTKNPQSDSDSDNNQTDSAETETENETEE